MLLARCSISYLRHCNCNNTLTPPRIFNEAPEHYREGICGASSTAVKVQSQYAGRAAVEQGSKQRSAHNSRINSTHTDGRTDDNDAMRARRKSMLRRPTDRRTPKAAARGPRVALCSGGKLLLTPDKASGLTARAGRPAGFTSVDDVTGQRQYCAPRMQMTGCAALDSAAE